MVAEERRERERERALGGLVRAQDIEARRAVVRDPCGKENLAEDEALLLSLLLLFFLPLSSHHHHKVKLSPSS